MKQWSKGLCTAILCILLTACVTGNTPQASAIKPYSEDISSYRIRYQAVDPPAKNNKSVSKDPELPVSPSNDITSTLNNKLEAIAEKNRKSKLAQGYRIMVYSGNSSDEAKRVKEKIYEFLPEESVYTTYRQPGFKVKVGDFFDRIEANYMLSQIKKQFPYAIVVPDQVNIN